MKTLYPLLLLLVITFSCDNDPCDNLPVGKNTILIVFSEVRAQKEAFINFFDKKMSEQIRERIKKLISHDTSFVSKVNVYLYELSSNTDGAPLIAAYEMSEANARNCCYSEKYTDEVIGQLKQAIKEKYRQKEKGVRIMPSLARIIDQVNQQEESPSKVSILYFSDMLEETADIERCGWYNFCKKGYDPILVDRAILEEAESDWNSGCMDDLIGDCKHWITSNGKNIEVFIYQPLNPRMMSDGTDGSHRYVFHFWKNRFKGVRTFKF